MLRHYGEPLLAAGFQAGRALVEAGLHVDDTELTILDFPMRGHGPDKADAVSGYGNVGMIAAGDQHGVAIADGGHEFRSLSIVVDELNAIRRLGHIAVDVHFFEHGGVLVGRPAGPVTWIGLGDAGDETASFDVFGQKHLELAPASGSAGGKLQAGISSDFGRADNLKRITLRDGTGEFSDVSKGICGHADIGIAREVNRVTTAHLDFITVHRDGGYARQADETSFSIAGGESFAGLSGI